MTITTTAATLPVQTQYEKRTEENKVQPAVKEETTLSADETLEILFENTSHQWAEKLPFAFPDISTTTQASPQKGTPEYALDKLIFDIEKIMARTSDPKARGGLVLSRLSNFERELGSIDQTTKDSLLEYLADQKGISSETLGWVQYHLENLDVADDSLEQLDQLINDVEATLRRIQDPKARGGVILSRLSQFSHDLGPVSPATQNNLLH